MHINAEFDPTYYALREQSPLAYKYGPYPIFTLGFIWFCLWSVIAGLLLPCSPRLGAVGLLPSGVSLMSNMYRPGPRKKLVFGLYGGSARASRLLVGIFITGQTGGNFEGLVGISG